ncbi:MAG: oligopeptidase A [Gammaproteobacteria bacterium]|nr:oligopeptidase A [Gammaproteobacteria bacterium]
MDKTVLAENPLLDFSGFPRFRDIVPDHVVPALDEILQNNRAKIDGLLDSETTPDWDNFIMPMEELDDQLERMWTPVSHLNNVMNNKALQEAYQDCLVKLSDYAAELGQNKVLFEKIVMIEKALSSRENGREHGVYSDIDEISYLARRKSIQNDLRDFKLSGIDLEGKDKERYREILSDLSQLTNEFSQNVQDATDGWGLHVTDVEDLKGIPESVVSMALDEARKKGLEGWQFNLQYPFFQPLMSHAGNRDLREKMYRAFVTRASEIGPCAGQWDNTSVMESILQLRSEKAQILGFRNYAEYSVETKMASSVEEVEKFLTDLSTKAKPEAEKEVAQLHQFAQDEYGVNGISPWDYGWFSEKLRQKRYEFSSEALRPFFPLPKVMSGMFEIVSRLFGIEIQVEEAPQIWHEDVMFFKVIGVEGGVIGYFYVDLFAREAKQGGAWMTDAVGRRKTHAGIQLPVAFLTCNFSKPMGDSPSLLLHDEVITLFHEFGHGLHHLLTQIEVAGVAGINGVPWDAVELPSQFLENWCWDREALDLISGHVETGERVPDDLLEKMHQARNFQSAMQMQRQIEFSLFDLRIHKEVEGIDGNMIQRILDEVRDDVAVVKAPEFNRFQHGFGHIFAGGYAAGYYSYKWAEVLSSDAFSLFEEKGIFDKETGASFRRCILEKGGSEEPASLFFDFRGREPDIEALLRHSGLSDNATPISIE